VLDLSLVGVANWLANRFAALLLCSFVILAARFASQPSGFSYVSYQFANVIDSRFGNLLSTYYHARLASVVFAVPFAVNVALHDKPAASLRRAGSAALQLLRLASTRR